MSKSAMSGSSIGRAGRGGLVAAPICGDLRPWVRFATASLGGLYLAFFPDLPDLASLTLLAALACLVPLGERLARATSASPRRDTSPPDGRQAHATGPPWLLAPAACLLLTLLFLALLPPEERRAWTAVMAALAAGLGFLWLLHAEGLPLDRRLPALSELLLGLPCLLIGFRAWGVGALPAFEAWAPLALFLPGLALVERAWMDGPEAPHDALTRALLPALLAIAWLSWHGQMLLALFFGLWSLRAAMLVLRRRAQPSAALPEFRSIQAFGRETCLWVAGFVLLWLFG